MKLFKAFGMRDLQRMLLILDMAEGEGVPDMQTLKLRLRNHIEADYARVKGVRVKSRVLQRKFSIPCPECGYPMTPARELDGKLVVEDGYYFLACKKCRHSIMKEVK